MAGSMFQDSYHAQFSMFRYITAPRHITDDRDENNCDMIQYGMRRGLVVHTFPSMNAWVRLVVNCIRDVEVLLRKWTQTHLSQ